MSGRIKIDRRDNRFYPGDEISGTVEYTFNKPKEVRGITISIIGYAHTEWTEQESYRDKDGNTKHKTITVTGHEDYVNIKLNVVGHSSGRVTLSAGFKSYPFRAILPENIPATYNGKYGNVRYEVCANVDIPWGPDDETNLCFTVMSKLDLNTIPCLGDPHSMEIDKTFCCCCCASGPMYVTMKLPATGFVPGQTIPIFIECDNASNVGVEKMTVALRKLETYRVHTPKSSIKTEKREIKMVEMGGVAADGSGNFSSALKIPDLPPSNLINCSIMDATYELKLTIHTDGWSVNVEKKVGITIGTIPLTTFDGAVDNVSICSGKYIEEEEEEKRKWYQIRQQGAPGTQSIGWNVEGGNSLQPPQMPIFPGSSDQAPQSLYFPVPPALPANSGGAPYPTRTDVPPGVFPGYPVAQQPVYPPDNSGYPSVMTGRQSPMNPGYPPGPSMMPPPPSFAESQNADSAMGFKATAPPPE